MAEAVMEDRPQPQRFYCHLCSVEVQSVNTDFTCPLCSGGFIEELPAPTEQSSEDTEMLDENGELNMIRDELATLLMSRGNSRPFEIESVGGSEDDSQQGNITGGINNGASGSNRSGGNSSGSGSGSSGGVGRRPNPLLVRMRNFNRIDNILFEILQSLSGGNEGALGNASMFFLGNPGDYAWGREGIDTIVTQLLNQMDPTGPPPLPKDKIDEIPNVDITQEQVDVKLQCSVCWEDFKLSESVRKLPCLHVYHENCIVPWLELHGTCPICRKSLTPETSTSEIPNSLHTNSSSMSQNVAASDELTISNGTPSANSNDNSSVLNGSSSQQRSTNSNPTNEGSSSSSSQDSFLSRIFSNPQQQSGTSMSSILSAQIPPTFMFSSLLQPMQHQTVGHHNSSSSSTGGDGGANSSSNPLGTGNNINNSGNREGVSDSRQQQEQQQQQQQQQQQDRSNVYRYDDGNVDFDFD